MVLCLPFLPRDPMAFVSKPWWKRLSEERFSGSFTSLAGESSRLASAPPCSSLKSSSGDDSDDSSNISCEQHSTIPPTNSVAKQTWRPSAADSEFVRRATCDGRLLALQRQKMVHQTARRVAATARPAPVKRGPRTQPEARSPPPSKRLPMYDVDVDRSMSPVSPAAARALPGTIGRLSVV